MELRVGVPSIGSTNANPSEGCLMVTDLNVMKLVRYTFLACTINDTPTLRFLEYGFWITCSSFTQKMLLPLQIFIKF